MIGLIYVLLSKGCVKILSLKGNIILELRRFLIRGMIFIVVVYIYYGII